VNFHHGRAKRAILAHARHLHILCFATLHLPCSVKSGLRLVVQTRPRTWPRMCCFCSSARGFALRLPSDRASQLRHCLRLVLYENIHHMTSNTEDLTTRAISPHKFTPVPGVYKRVEPERHDWRSTKKKQKTDLTGSFMVS